MMQMFMLSMTMMDGCVKRKRGDNNDGDGATDDSKHD